MKHLFASTAIALALGLGAPAMAQEAASDLNVKEAENPATAIPEPGATTTGQDAITQPPSAVIDTTDSDSDVPRDKADEQAAAAGEGSGEGSGDLTVIQKEHSIPGQPALGQNLEAIQGGGLALVPSQDLSKRELKTTQSEPLGQVAYVAVDTETGRISYLLTPITGQGDVADPPERFRVLPWEAVKQEGQDFSVDMTREQAEAMPEISRQDLRRLGEESFRQDVQRRWQGEQAQADAGQDQQQGQQQDRQQAAQVDLPQGHPPVMLVGPEGAEVIGREGLPTSAVIVDAQGAKLADLDHVMVDTAHGVIAYTILSEPGPAEKLAFRTSPLASLKWDEERQAFIAPQGMGDSPSFASSDEAQGSVQNQNQLSEMYEGSGVPPYWEGGQAQPDQAPAGGDEGVRQD